MNTNNMKLQTPSKRDRKGIFIQYFDTVEVPEPNDTDVHNHSFDGTVTGERNGNIIVEDGEGNSFEIEPERLEVVNREF